MCASAFLSPARKCLLHPLTQQQQHVHLILNEAELPGLLSLVHLGGKTHPSKSGCLPLMIFQMVTLALVSPIWW